MKPSEGNSEFAEAHAPHLPALDGLRGAAALMVVYGHAGYWGWVPLLSGLATIGVVLFFFLSGFLMGHHYSPPPSLGIVGKGPTRYWLGFLLRRFLRVYPAYFLAPIVGFLLLMPAMPSSFDTLKPLGEIDYWREIYNIATFHGDVGIYWTIQEELRFYLFYPIVFGAFALASRRPVSLLAIIVILSIFTHTARQNPHWPAYMAMFVSGVMTSAVMKSNPELWGLRRFANVATIASFAAFVILVSAITQSSPTQASIWRMGWLFEIVFFLMFASVINSNGVIARALSSRIATTIGRLSYSLYLMHIISFHLTKNYLGDSPPMALWAAVTVTVLTIAYYACVERWFVILSKRVRVTGGKTRAA